MIKSLIHLWHKWGTRAGLSILDQCVFSSSNFILNILLVRWLVPSEYGIFAIAFAAFLFISGFHNALVLEPMSVIGASRYKEKISLYLEKTAIIHWILTLVFSVILILAAGIMANSKNRLTVSFLGLAISAPFMLFFWLFRQACYLGIKPALAFKGSLFYGAILITGAALLRKQHLLSPFSAFIVMALASLLVSMLLWRFIDTKGNRTSASHNNLSIKRILFENWHYGRWVVGSAFVNWLSSVVYLPFVAVLVGFEQAGAFRAMQNLILPLERSLVGLGLLLLPWLSRQRLLHGEGYLKNKLVKIIIINFFFASGYLFLLILFGRYAATFLYGQSYANNFVWLLPYIGIAAVVNAIAIGLYTGFRAVERPDVIFWSQTVGALSTLTLGLSLVRNLKLYGAALGQILTITSITLVFWLFIFYRLKLNKRSKGEATFSGKG